MTSGQIRGLNLFLCLHCHCHSSHTSGPHSTRAGCELCAQIMQLQWPIPANPTPCCRWLCCTPMRPPSCGSLGELLLIETGTARHCQCADLMCCYVGSVLQVCSSRRSSARPWPSGLPQESRCLTVCRPPGTCWSRVLVRPSLLLLCHVMMLPSTVRCGWQPQRLLSH